MADVALNLVVIGPPGAGQGTQAERFAREHGIPKISTGDILREAVAAGTSLGRQVKAVMDRGELVGDDLITGIVNERLSRPDVVRGFLLDATYRTIDGAQTPERVGHALVAAVSSALGNETADAEAAMTAGRELKA